MLYRFVGTNATFGPMSFDTFGQQVNMEPDQAEMAQRGGVALLPDAEFQKFGWTSEDLKIWASPFTIGNWQEVPSKPEEARSRANFDRKHAAVQAAYVSLRAKLLSNEPQPAHPVIAEEVQTNVE